MSNLRGNQIMLEVSPPSRLASEKSVASSVEKISSVVSELDCVDFVNIPEIVDENHEGKPFYKNMDTRDFGVLLRDATGKDVVVNKVTVHCAGNADFQNWLKRTVFDYSIKNVVFVGGTDASMKYPGVPVTQANLEAKTFDGLSVGNICIPNRENEAERLLAKTKSGCSFFTTQIIFECESTKKVLEEYYLKCVENSLKPAVFFLGFAPVGKSMDVEFYKWLGAKIPRDVEEKLSRKGQDAGAGTVSIELAKQISSELKSYLDDENIKVPISLNVESIFLHNLDLAKEMTFALRNT